MRRPLYADTLEMVAMKGADSFYNSNFTTEMVTELRELYDAIVTTEDFNRYVALERTVTSAYYQNYQVHGLYPPNSGAVLGLILNMLDCKLFCRVDS